MGLAGRSDSPIFDRSEIEKEALTLAVQNQTPCRVIGAEEKTTRPFRGAAHRIFALRQTNQPTNDPFPPPVVACPLRAAVPIPSV